MRLVFVLNMSSSLNKDIIIIIIIIISGNVEHTIRSKNAGLFDRPVLQVRQLN